MTIPGIGSGSYSDDDVRFLLEDLRGKLPPLSHDVRERRIQGGQHYAEMLPREDPPTADHLAVFDRALREHASTMATLVRRVTEDIAGLHPSGCVLVSLARAGTPVGALIRRALRDRGIDAPHYSISIVRGRGIDTRALDWIHSRHPRRPIQFVDGWTGKGAIAGELARAVAPLGLDPALVVLADPAGVAAIAGTTADVLVPSACLNATVAGLVSRTILRPDLLAPEGFHGTCTFPELARWDRSNQFVDCIDERRMLLDLTHGPAGDPDIETSLPRGRDAPSGSAARPAPETVVTALMAVHGLPDRHLVKPGAGETMRALLRRMPSLVLLDEAPDLEPIAWLARRRGVRIERWSHPRYRACAVIGPQSTT